MLLQAFKNTILRYQMLSPEDKVIIGVSGGADSIALLYLLNQIKDEFNLVLFVAHLNHLLRGDESDRESFFVKDFAEKKLNLPVFIKKIDVQKEAKIHKTSIETISRKLRYDFFSSLARQLDANKIALGHQLDDNIETILLNLFRGTGLKGVSGIPPIRRISSNLTVVRPLIEIPSSKIRNFLKEKDIDFCIDSSNFDLIYQRNTIRLKILPFLKKFYPQITKNILRFSRIAGLEDEFLEEETKKTENFLLTEEDNETYFNIAFFERQHPAIQKRIIKRLINRHKKIASEVVYEDVERFLGLIKNNKPNLSLRLKDLWIEKEYDLVKIKPYKDKKKIFFRYPLKEGNKELFIKEIPLKIKIDVFKKDRKVEDYIKNKKPSVTYFDFDLLKQPLYIRSRRSGDRFCPDGLGGSKKLKDFLIDKKIPLNERDKILLLEDGYGIAGILGYRVDERVKLTEKTQNILCLEFY
jgi:tRNA(Ile)-lysidine synthase